MKIENNAAFAREAELFKIGFILIIAGSALAGLSLIINFVPLTIISLSVAVSSLVGVLDKGIKLLEYKTKKKNKETKLDNSEIQEFNLEDLDKSLDTLNFTSKSCDLGFTENIKETIADMKVDFLINGVKNLKVYNNKLLQKTVKNIDFQKKCPDFNEMTLVTKKALRKASRLYNIANDPKVIDRLDDLDKSDYKALYLFMKDYFSTDNNLVSCNTQNEKALIKVKFLNYYEDMIMKKSIRATNLDPDFAIFNKQIALELSSIYQMINTDGFLEELDSLNASDYEMIKMFIKKYYVNGNNLEQIENLTGRKLIRNK